MLIKARLGDIQKFVRVTEPHMKEFLIAGKKLSLELGFPPEALRF